MDKSILFSPLALRHITLPGRMVRSATEFFCAGPDAHTFSYEYEVFERLGQEPLGLIITGHTCVSPEGHSNHYQNAIWDDSFIPDARHIAAGAMAHGVPAIMQLGHGGMKAEGNNDGLPVYTPDTMTVEQIHAVVAAFAAAAVRAKTAGFSGVMLHGAHRYLLSQFFYPVFNHRTDAYGGSAENRFRIIREAFFAIKEACGEDFPVFLKINGNDETDTEEYHQDLVTALRTLEHDLEAVEISGWFSEKRGVPDGPYFIDNIRRLKDELDLPLIEVGGLRSAKDLLDALEAGASAVSMSRPLVCQPDFPSRIRDEENAVSPCRGCGYCYRPIDRDHIDRCPLHHSVS